MSRLETYKREEQQLQKFNTVQEAIEYAREHMDCSTADNAGAIMRTPDNKNMVCAKLHLCSYLDMKGYKKVIGTFDLADVIEGKAKFTDVIEEM